jgi:lysophospholipase L1-like esterase
MVALAGGCAEEVSPAIEPSHGPASGYYRVVVTEPGLMAREVTAVKVGGVGAYDVSPAGDHTLVFTVQGHGTPGAADIEVTTADGASVLAQRFTYDAPLDARFGRFVAMGASLTQGVQNGVPTQHGGLMSPPAQMARQMGAYLPLPLLVREFLPEMSADDIGPPPGCAPPDVSAFVASAAIDVLPLLVTGYHNARVDPDIAIQNVAVGGSRVKTIVHGPPPEDFGGQFVGKLVLDPFATDAVDTSELELAEALEPTLVVITDLFYNDVAAAVLGGDTIDPTRMTPVEDYEVDLVTLLDRLEATGAEVFISNMPRPSVLPLTREKRARMIAAAVARGGDADEAAAAADEAIATMDAAAEAFNDILVAQMSARNGMHLVDARARIAELAETGLSVGGQALRVAKFGGLLSFDGVHFTDTGYAMFANLFLDAINAELGTAVPAIDLASVIGDDVGSPANIAAAGLDVTPCVTP